MKKRAILCPFGISLLITLTLLSARGFCADWPQLGNGPQRWNLSTETIPPPYELKWSVNLHFDVGVEHWMYGAAQVIIADGRCYIGSRGGTLFAMDAQTGDIEWEFDTDGPIRHTAGCENGKVFVASMDGCVYALDAATGSELWRFDNERLYGFSTAVLLAEGNVFAVDRGGYLYALSQADGSEVWAAPYDANAPVFQSPSYNNGKIYFGDQNMYVHAVNSSDGTGAWVSNRVNGRSFVDYYPVIWADKVIVRPRVGFEKTGTLEGYVDSFVILNESDGTEPYSVPHYHMGGWCGPIAPPSITYDGYMVHGWKVVPDNDWSCAGFALYDLTNNQLISELKDATSEGKGARDEPMITSTFGDIVIAIHHYSFGWGNPPGTQSGAFNRVEWDWYTSGQMQPPPDIMPWGGNLCAGGNNAVAGANGLLYHHTLRVVYCWEPAN